MATGFSALLVRGLTSLNKVVVVTVCSTVQLYPQSIEHMKSRRLLSLCLLSISFLFLINLSGLSQLFTGSITQIGKFPVNKRQCSQ